VINAPASFLLEIQLSFIDTNDPAKVREFQFTLQSQLLDVNRTLASAGYFIAGPNLELTPDNNVLRIGIWVINQSDSNPPPSLQPPDLPMPVLSDSAQIAAFANTPRLLRGTSSTSGLSVPVAFSLPVATIQTYVDALAPLLTSNVSQQVPGFSLKSVTVTSTDAPGGNPGGTITTTLAGDVGVPAASFTGSITETLGLTPFSATQAIPAVTGPSVSSGTDVTVQTALGVIALLGSPLSVFAAILGPALIDEAVLVTSGVPPAIKALGNTAGATAANIVNSIPPSVPLRAWPAAGAYFPAVIPNWSFFGVKNASLTGVAVATLVARDASMATFSLSGPTRFMIPQHDATGGIEPTYGLRWNNLIPDEIDWSVTHSTSGDSNSTANLKNAPAPAPTTVAIDLLMPARPKLGNHLFAVTVNAVEISQLDSSKTLSLSQEITVNATVIRTPSGNQ
jgi:hypothetical protein